MTPFTPLKVQGGGDVGAALVEHPAIDMVGFTGTVRVLFGK
jgi:acyl-CoA reductase-like NAD-dependent aldehyde dehydrogenase